MSLSLDLISQFAKLTTESKPKNNESTVYGTIVESDGKQYVRIDGSDRLTPVEKTVDTKVDENGNGDRVMVLIKNHSATVMGNISSPAARTDDVKDLSNKITEVDILVANRIDAQTAVIDELVSDNVVIRETLSATNAQVVNLEANKASVDQLNAHKAEVENLVATKLDADVADITYATVGNLEATNADIHNLEADYGEFKELVSTDFETVNANIENLEATQVDIEELNATNATIEALRAEYAEFKQATVVKLDAADADIQNLEAEKLTAEDANLLYATIDFSNIGEAAVEKLFSDSGIIDSLVMSEGHVTGKLVGVTIIGDLIEGGTVKADRLVIQGEDGLYYKLNTDGETVTSQQTEYNSLNGGIITASSITAEKIDVDDIVAFNATIGGFHITNDAIYSGVKASVDNTTRGLYFDNTGKLAFGDSTNFVKFYEDEGVYKLAIAANKITFGANNTDVEDVAIDARSAQQSAEAAQDAANANAENISAAIVDINSLNSTISNLVVGPDGTSLMTQTDNGWVFDMANTLDTLNAATANIDNVMKDLEAVGADVSSLQVVKNSFEELNAYVRIVNETNSEGQPIPVIELGNSSQFRVRITNTSIDFMEGTGIPAYINNQQLNIDKARVQSELKIGNFSFIPRTNGNVGLVWKG